MPESNNSSPENAIQPDQGIESPDVVNTPETTVKSSAKNAESRAKDASERIAELAENENVSPEHIAFLNELASLGPPVIARASDRLAAVTDNSQPVEAPAEEVSPTPSNNRPETVDFGFMAPDQDMLNRLSSSRRSTFDNLGGNGNES